MICHMTLMTLEIRSGSPKSDDFFSMMYLCQFCLAIDSEKSADKAFCILLYMYDPSDPDTRLDHGHHNLGIS